MSRRRPIDVQAAEETFVRYLRARGTKYTRPRRAILRTVLKMHEHFEAERLLGQLRQAGLRVGKATVYRTLPLLVDCGILKQVRFLDERVHYEHTFGEDAHDHMVCRGCGRIIEFDSAGVEQLRDAVAREHHFQAVSHRLQISGWCAECAQRQPPAASSGLA